MRLTSDYVITPIIFATSQSNNAGFITIPLAQALDTGKTGSTIASTTSQNGTRSDLVPATTSGALRVFSVMLVGIVLLLAWFCNKTGNLFDEIFGIFSWGGFRNDGKWWARIQIKSNPHFICISRSDFIIVKPPVHHQFFSFFHFFHNFFNFFSPFRVFRWSSLWIFYISVIISWPLLHRRWWQHRKYRQTHALDRKNGTPTVVQNREADVSVAVDMRVLGYVISYECDLSKSVEFHRLVLQRCRWCKFWEWQDMKRSITSGASRGYWFGNLNCNWNFSPS